MPKREPTLEQKIKVMPPCLDRANFSRIYSALDMAVCWYLHPWRGKPEHEKLNAIAEELEHAATFAATMAQSLRKQAQQQQDATKP